MAEIFNLMQAEGVTGRKKTFVKDPWPDIYASRQNRGTILQGIVTAIEEHGIQEQKVACAVVMMEYVKGIIPIQESNCQNKNQLRKLMGQIVAFKVIGIERDSNLFVASRKQAIEQMSKITWESLKIGDIRTAVVREVRQRGVIIDIGGIVTELTADQLTWGWVRDVRELLEVGENFDVKIIYLDKDKKELKASVKELLPSPWPGVMKRYTKGMEIVGTVTGTADYGIYVNLEPGVDLLAKQRRENIRPQAGQRVVAVITDIDPQKKHIKGFIKSNLGRIR